MEYFRSGYNACLLDLTHETMTSPQFDAAARTSFLSIFSKLSDESYQAFSTTIKPVSNEKVVESSSSKPCSQKPSEVSVIVKNKEDIDQNNNEDIDLNNNTIKKIPEKKTISKRKIFKPSQAGEKRKKISEAENFMRQLGSFDSDIDEEVFTDILLTTTAIPEVKISIGKTSTINTNSKKIATSLPQLVQPPNLFHPHFIMERKLLGMREPPKASVNTDGEGKGITTTVFSTHSKSCSGQGETELHQIKLARDSFKGIDIGWPRDRSLLPPVTVFL